PVVQTYVLARPGAATGGGVLPAGERGAYTETLLVLGVDPFSEGPFARYRPPAGTRRTALLEFMVDPHAAAVTRALADRYGLHVGSALTVLSAGRPVTLTVQQVIESQELQQAMGGNVVLMDIAAAQELFHRYG